jgi:hypothetical protein
MALPPPPPPPIQYLVVYGRECPVPLKVHKIENCIGSDFEFCVISLLVMLKY